MKIRRGHLIRSKPEDILRLARWLRLQIQGMKHKQIASLVYWRVTRNENNRH